MKRVEKKFTGTRPVFSGCPSIVPGGFNLDKKKQNFAVGSVIPAGSLAIYDEQKRTVLVVKTAKVVDVNSEDKKMVTLLVDEFFAPCFAVGDKVAKAGAISGNYADAISVEKVESTDKSFVMTLSGEVSGLAKGDVIVQVVDGSPSAIEIGAANSVTIADVVVGEFETSVDVTADTMQYTLFERRVPPIPESQKDSTGSFLKANPHVRLSQSF